MAWTSADVPLAERLARVDDKPILIGANALDRPAIVAQWRSDVSPSLLFGDQAAVGAEASRVYSRAATPRSYPSVARSEWWLLFELGASAAGSVEFDTLVILNHNLAELLEVTARVDLATSTDYSSGFQSITPDFVVPGPRCVRYHLGTGGVPQRFTGSGYGRIRLTSPYDFLPEIGSVWLGRRRQLSRGPDVPHDGSSTRSRAALGSSVGGAPSMLELHNGRRTLRAAWTIEEEDADQIRAWHLECRRGSAPFLWIPAPSSRPNAVELHRLRRPDLQLSLAGASHYTVRIEADELPPFASSEAT